MAMTLTTSYAYPWALLMTGGASPGQRPRTQLAWITEAVAKQGDIVGYRVVPFRGGSRPTLRARLVEPSAIVKTWRGRPREDQLNKARLALAPTRDWRLDERGA
jgi:hypothetical protein